MKLRRNNIIYSNANRGYNYHYKIVFHTSPQSNGDEHLANTVIKSNKIMLDIEIMASTYPYILDISSKILPSLSHPKSPAKAFEMMNPTLYNPIEINVGKTISSKTTIKTIPTFVLKYSMLAPAVRKDSPTVPPTRGIICVASIFAVLVLKESALLAIKVWVDITVVNISIIIPKKNVNAFLIALLKGKILVSPINEDATVKPRQTPNIASNDIIHTFSSMDRKTIRP